MSSPTPPPTAGGVSVSATQDREQRRYARRIRQLGMPDEIDEGHRLVAFSSPNPWRNWWVNKAIKLGVRNPLGDDLDLMDRQNEAELEMARARARIMRARGEIVDG